MTISVEKERELYNEGYSAGSAGLGEESNPYTGLEAEYWSDGCTDAEEDLHD